MELLDRPAVCCFFGGSKPIDASRSIEASVKADTRDR
jgi:hypothetical protein